MTGHPGDPTAKKVKKPFVPLERDYEHHRFWPTQTGETFIKAIAFEDLWLKTEIGPRVRYVEGVRIELGPGQCIVDERTLAARWKWSRGRVRRFLNDLSMGGEAALERYHWGTRLTLHKQVAWWSEHPADGTTNRTGDSTTESPVTVPPSIPRPRDCETTPGGDVDKSVDNIPMTRKVDEVVEEFKRASGIIRPPSVREKVRVEKAIVQNAGDHVPIREYVRECITRAKAGGADPTSVSYAIAAWERERLERESASRRPASRREPEERPLRPAYHGPAKPLPRRELTDEQQKGALTSIGSVIAKLGLPTTGGKK